MRRTTVQPRIPDRGTTSATVPMTVMCEVGVAMLLTLGSLFMGIFNMARGGDPKLSNKFMRYRIWFQGTALLLFVIFMMLYRR